MSYREYFNIDPEYFPQVDKKLIEEKPDLWKKFWPHPTFVQLLKAMVDVLERKQKLSMWVDGAYGTGKSHAVFTLKKLIEASDEETTAYFEKYALLERLKESGLDFVRNGARNHIPGNISVSFKDADGEAILHRLDLMGICVSTGSACDSVSTQISHVLKAIKLKDNYARGTIRISFGKENTFEEANIIAESLIRILKK